MTTGKASSQCGAPCRSTAFRVKCAARTHHTPAQSVSADVLRVVCLSLPMRAVCPLCALRASRAVSEVLPRVPPRLRGVAFPGGLARKLGGEDKPDLPPPAMSKQLLFILLYRGPAGLGLELDATNTVVNMVPGGAAEVQGYFREGDTIASVRCSCARTSSSPNFDPRTRTVWLAWPCSVRASR